MKVPLSILATIAPEDSPENAKPEPAAWFADGCGHAASQEL